MNRAVTIHSRIQLSNFMWYHFYVIHLKKYQVEDKFNGEIINSRKI